MRVLKIVGAVLFLAAALAAGVVATAVVATIGLVVFGVRRLLRRQLSSSGSTNVRPRAPSPGDAIDVEATDISSDRRQIP